MTTESDLLAYINAEVKLDRSADIEIDTDLLLTGLVDSIGVIGIVGWLEDNHGVEIDPLDVVLDNFQTVRQMMAFLDRIQSATQSE